MDPLAPLEVVEEIAENVADAINFEVIEKKWWWLPLKIALYAIPFVAIAIYYYS